MHISDHATANPAKAAIIMADSGETISYADLERRSNQAAHLLRASGLGVGDGMAVLLPNEPALLEIAWAAQRAGLYLTCISTRLTAPEIAYIVHDSGAKALIASPEAPIALEEAVGDGLRFMVRGTRPGFTSWESAAGSFPDTRIADERAGTDMLYSSGTTGRPKGVRRAMPVDGDIGELSPFEQLVSDRFGIDADTMYLCPAPLYHAAPLRWTMAVQRLGGTAIIMEKFDAERALALIERYRVTHAQFVPTHFVRMLKLPEEARMRHDVSFLRHAVHAAAPCPVPIKQAMLNWWGPIIDEYYGGTEGNGMTMISAAEWLERPGSVGRAVTGTLHICDDAGEPLPADVDGNVFFADGPSFEYHNDPEKTAGARNVRGWTTIGDIGRLDRDGYLYLTDRKSFMIISGGVNIYPQEVENLLVTHDAVADAAVFGVPDDEMGERVIAVVQPMRVENAGPALSCQLLAWLRERLSPVKLPRRIDFRAELPREVTGKLHKRKLQLEYMAARELEGHRSACLNRDLD